MFKKILLAEDIDSINVAVIQILEELGVAVVDHAKYCDDALLKIKKAHLDNAPYDLLISDLSFEDDYRTVTIKSGDELVKKAKQIQPNLKVIVYSIEDKSYRIKSLFENLKINAFVHKGRKSIEQLKIAIDTILNTDAPYISPEIAFALKDKTVHEIDDYDVQLIKQLSFGIPQDHMDTKFMELGITPNSKSTIEKRISRLKDFFKAQNTVHLIAIAKDMGII